MSDWQPIDQTVPPDGAVWIYCDDGMRHIAVLERHWDWKALAYRKTWDIFWPEYDGKKSKTVTHWKPLPEPPK